MPKTRRSKGAAIILCDAHIAGLCLAPTRLHVRVFAMATVPLPPLNMSNSYLLLCRPIKAG